MILDVGCGDRPQGDVNVDLNVGKTDELYFENRLIKPKLIPNFVRADAYHLPFKYKSFHKVCCFHLLEHLTDPMKALKEFRRVVNGTIEIRLPVKQHEGFQCFFVPRKRDYTRKYHKNSFTFKNMQKMVPNANVRYSYFIFYVLKNLKALRKVTPPFLKFLFFSFGSTFFPPIPDVIVVKMG